MVLVGTGTLIHNISANLMKSSFEVLVFRSLINVENLVVAGYGGGEFGGGWLRGELGGSEFGGVWLRGGDGISGGCGGAIGDGGGNMDGGGGCGGGFDDDGDDRRRNQVLFIRGGVVNGSGSGENKGEDNEGSGF
ncbi:ctenidin-1-like [Papaver somniferum]|uniref:ctenidin-1-like n=1 Tax=Papaver somniferum TaxID=3469 RepID=UPI000E6F75C4|nr:ctenidin-1-like [Papaver somniferum]